MIFVLNLFDLAKGKEKIYANYFRRVQAILERYGASIILYGRTRHVYMGTASQEYCGIVSYPDMTALKNFSDDSEFQDIRLLRDTSTKNYVLTVIEGFDTTQDAIDYIESEQ